VQVPPPADPPSIHIDVLDLSALALADDGWQIDTGVTSGADSSEWDSIDVDSAGRVDTCDNSDGKQAAAVCKSSQREDQSPESKPPPQPRR
jgi:hypothetical protein